METGMTSSEEIDFWRDTYVRYMGYANEVGEAFRPLYPRFVIPSYVVAFAYVGCDSASKFMQSRNAKEDTKTSFIKGFDALLWQTFASVIIPGKVIHGITSLAAKTVSSVKWKRPSSIHSFIPTIVGLLAIPAIIHPIDHAVDYAMDITFRKWVHVDEVPKSVDNRPNRSDNQPE